VFLLLAFLQFWPLSCGRASAASVCCGTPAVALSPFFQQGGARGFVAPEQPAKRVAPILMLMLTMMSPPPPPTDVSLSPGRAVRALARLEVRDEQ